MQTRQFPRTMEQAFGPYARGPIHPMPEPKKQRDKLVTADNVVTLVSAVTAVGLVLAICLGWLK